MTEEARWQDFAAHVWLRVLVMNIAASLPFQRLGICKTVLFLGPSYGFSITMGFPCRQIGSPLQYLLVWRGLLWSGMVWFDLIRCLEIIPAGLGRLTGLAWPGMVWFPVAGFVLLWSGLVGMIRPDRSGLV